MTLPRIFLLIFGIFCSSTAVLMIKESNVGPVLLSSLRVFVAAAALSPLFLVNFRRHRGEMSFRHWRMTLIPGLFLALHFIFWLIGARMTPVANSTLIVNFAPVAVPFLLLGSGERLTRRELLATAIAVGGVTILGASDFSISMIHFWGDVICFVAMLMFACYLVLGRRTRQYPSIWIYLVPLYAFAGVVCMLAVPIAGEKPIWPTTPKEILLVLGLGLVPTVLGHSILNYSMKHLRGQIVSIMNMGQFIFAGVMAYFLRNEIPHWPYYIASLMIVSGSLLALLQRAEKKDEQVIEQVAAATAET